MSTPEPAPDPPPRRKPLVRLWLVSLLLFAGGFAGKLVMEGGKPPDQGYPLVMLWQMGWYAAGLVAWFWWACAQSALDKLGCGVGLGLAIGAVLAVLSSSPK